MKKINKKGFTLIELLVVIAIIGLLSTLAVVALNNARSKSRDAKRVADVKQMQTALELYYNDCNQYPTVAAAMDLPGTLAAENDGCTAPTTLGTFLSQVPTAPNPADGGCSAAENTYTYTSTTALGAACAAGVCASYTIDYCLGAQTGGLTAGTHLASPAGM